MISVQNLDFGQVQFSDIRISDTYCHLTYLKISCDQKTMSHDAVVGQLPVHAHVLRVGQGCGRDPIHWRRVGRASFLEQLAPGSDHVAV